MATTTLTSSAASRGGVRLWRRQRIAPDLLALLTLLIATATALIVSYSRASTIQLGVAGRYHAPHLVDFHEPETIAGQQEATYRWTGDQSTIRAPGLGRGLWATTLELSSPVAAGEPKLARVAVDGQTWPLQLTPQPRSYHLITPSRGDMSVRIDTVAQSYGADPRELGIVFFGAAFRPVAVGAFPPALLLAHSLFGLILAYLTLRLIGWRPALALIGPLGALLLLAWSIAANRAPLGLLAPRLSALAIAGLLAILLLRWAWNRLVALGRLEPEPWLLPALLTIMYVGFWIKAGGMLYPYSHVIDVPWHMQRTREILSGRLFELYRPGAFSESVMPLDEWGAERPVIPYSPYFHILATVFAIFPWPLETSANVFSAFFDTNRALLIAALALGFGLRSRAALLAALLYAVTPFTYLLHSWGNIPTTFGMWWTLLATTIIVLGFDRLHERRIFALLTAVLLATLLFYTVMAVFMGVFIVLLLMGLAIWGRELPRRSVYALAASSALALGLSLLVYYGQYIDPIVERTLPYINRTVVGGQEGEGQAELEPFAKYVSNYVPHIGYLTDPGSFFPLRLLPLPYLPSSYNSGRALWYGVALPLVVGLPAVWLLRRNRLALLILGVWILVAALFFLAGSRVSMVDKHLFYIVPALTITTAAALDRAWQRWRWTGAAIAITYLGAFTSALALWLMRLQRVG